MTHEQLVEKVARIVDPEHDAEWWGDDDARLARSAVRTAKAKETARAILSLIAEALGEPTEGMIEALRSRLDIADNGPGPEAIIGLRDGFIDAIDASPLKGPNNDG